MTLIEAGAVPSSSDQVGGQHLENREEGKNMVNPQGPRPIPNEKTRGKGHFMTFFDLKPLQIASFLCFRKSQECLGYVSGKKIRDIVILTLPPPPGL